VFSHEYIYDILMSKRPIRILKSQNLTYSNNLFENCKFINSPRGYLGNILTFKNLHCFGKTHRTDVAGFRNAHRNCSMTNTFYLYVNDKISCRLTTTLNLLYSNIYRYNKHWIDKHFSPKSQVPLGLLSGRRAPIIL